MDNGRRLVGGLIALLTFVSILGIMYIWLRASHSMLLGLYSVSITGFLLFMYATTAGYKPLPDLGFRPELTIVIPAKNEEEVIESVIRTVFNSDYPIEKLRVIAVDDGSTDHTWEGMLRVKRDSRFSDRLELIRHDQNYGKRVALASAILKISTEIVLCIDSDSFVNRDAIRLLVQPFHDQRVAAACGHGESMNKAEGIIQRLQHYWYADSFRLVKGMESRFGCVLCCSGMLAAYRREVILPLIHEWQKEKPETSESRLRSAPSENWIGRGLSSKLIKSPGEDRILTAYALSAKGARSVYQSNAIVRTIVPDSSKQFLRQQLRWTRGWIHGSVLSWRFMWRKSAPAAIITYLFQTLLLLSPVVVVLWLFVKPIEGQWLGTAGFLAGTIYIGLIHGLNTWKYQRTPIESAPYRMLFGFVSIFVTLSVMLYGILTPWKGGWLTRTDSVLKPQPVVTPETEVVEPIVA